MESETEGRAHGRAPGLVAAAGAWARLRPVNNAARQLGPRGPREKVARIKAGKGLESQLWVRVRIQVQGHPLLRSKYEASLGYMKLCKQKS